MLTFLKTLALFVPLVLVIMEGPGLYYVLGLGMLGAVGEVVRLGRTPILMRCWLPLLGVFVWCACNSYFGRDPADDVIPSKSLFLCFMYGVPVGVCLHEWNRRTADSSVLIGYVVTAFLLALICAQVVRSGNVQIEVETVGGVTNRTSSAKEGLTFWGYFSMGNVVIGIVPYTIFGLSLPLLAVTRLKPYLLGLVFGAFLVGIYVSAKVVTRTAVGAAALSSAIMIVLLARKGVGRLKGSAKWGLIVIVATFMLLFGALVASALPEFQTLVDRFSETSRDGRLDLWQEGFENILRRPWGTGNELMVTAPWSHNIFLDFALWNGVVGLCAMLCVLSVPVINFCRFVQRKEFMEQPLNLALSNAFLSAMVVGLLHPPQRPMFIYYFIFMGYTIGAFADARLPWRKLPRPVWRGPSPLPPMDPAFDVAVRPNRV